MAAEVPPIVTTMFPHPRSEEDQNVPCPVAGEGGVGFGIRSSFLQRVKKTDNARTSTIIKPRLLMPVKVIFFMIFF
jgi:hypothetical protein